MKTVLVLRHAKSSWDDPALSDHDRPLNKRGLHDAPRVGRVLAEADLIPDLILASTAVRALQTATFVAQACRYDRELRTLPQLYLAEAGVYLDVLLGLAPSYARVLLVGHNPGIEELVQALTGREERMPTAALAHVQFAAERWADIAAAVPGELVRVWRMKHDP